MKEAIAILALALLVLPLLGAVRRLRNLPAPERRKDEQPLP